MPETNCAGARIGPPVQARVLQAADHLPGFDQRRPVVDRQNEARRGDHLLDRRFLLALGRAVVAGDARLHVADFAERFDQLIVDVVEHVAADRRHPFRRLDDDVHRAFGVAARRLADQSGHQFGRAGDFQIEKAQRSLGVEAIDQMLDVDRGILRMHQAGDRIFKLAPVEDDRGVHGKEIVLAGVVDVQMRVQDVAHVAEPQSVLLELVLDHVLVRLHAAHAERLHDLVGAVARVDHHRPGAAEHQKAQRWHPPRAAAIAPEHQKARFEFDIAVVEDLDFKRHAFLPRPDQNVPGQLSR